MNNKNNSIKKLLTVSACALLMIALSWLITNISVLRNAESRTVSYIGADEAVITENADGSEEIAFYKEAGVYIHKLRFDVTSPDERPQEICVTVSCLENGSEIKKYQYNDTNPIYVGTEVISIDKKNITGISITDGSVSNVTAEGAEAGTENADYTKKAHAAFSIGGFAVDNRLGLNVCAAIFAALFGIALSEIIVYRDVNLRRPEYVFIIICLSMGLSMLMGLPSTKVGYDEETHMQSVFALAALPGGELHFNDDALNQVLITEYNNPGALPASAEESKELSRALSERCDYRFGGSTPTFKVMPSRVPAYICMAAGLKLAKLFHPGWSTLIFVMRLSNLLMYAALMYAAIRIVPRAKWLMLFIALLPQNIFMAVTCSYDPFVTGCISLGYAFMLNGRKYILPMTVSFISGCLPKAVYIPVVLLGLAVSLSVGKIKADEQADAANDDCRMQRARAEAVKRAEKRKRIGIILLGAAVFAVFIAMFILPTVISPDDTGDIRGGEVSALSQVRFILSNPFTYAGILLRQMAGWFGKCWFGADCMTFMGHIVNGYTDFRGYCLPYMLMLAVGLILSHRMSITRLTVHRETERSAENADLTVYGAGDSLGLSVPLRLWMLLMVFAASVLIWTAMYVAFTVPGAPEIAGVQGRYFIPLMFPAYLTLSGGCDILPVCNDTGAAEGPVHIYSDNGALYASGGFLARKTALCYYLLELLVIALTVWRCIIAAFCL